MNPLLAALAAMGLTATGAHFFTSEEARPERLKLTAFYLQTINKADASSTVTKDVIKDHLKLQRILKGLAVDGWDLDDLPMVAKMSVFIVSVQGQAEINQLSGETVLVLGKLSDNVEKFAGQAAAKVDSFVGRVAKGAEAFVDAFAKKPEAA
ncbi:MAG: hypothetical protein V4436_01210 [Patescibacteria group bacterium]